MVKSADELIAMIPGASPELFSSLCFLTSILLMKGSAELVGQTKQLAANSSKELAAALQRYIDSPMGRPIVPAKRRRAPRAVPQQDVALWPLVRKVTIKCDSPALSTGAVLVDLPGVADANLARARVAEKYLDEATFVWIVARIHRVADTSFVRGKPLVAFYTLLLLLCSVNDRHTPQFYRKATSK